ncbi:MAG: NAD(P)H-quinone oxidoreductase [Acidobacteria bacterium]|nr:NAD(P)H-quinone oxidoreductase [Acidobacteriota bacterium]
MKAVYIRSFGGPENLEIRDVPDPSPPVGSEVLVRVRAAGLNRADLLQRRGLYPPPAGYSPHIPGLEFAGEIVETGNDASAWKARDRVFGISAGEAQAELLIADASVLAKIPDNLSFTEAAAVPEAFVTAHDAVFTQGELKKGETLLVHAVGSGVGLAALQLAKAARAKTIGTSRTAEKLERSKKFGLDEAILTGENTEFAPILKSKNGGGVDVILDLVGAGYFRENLECLLPKGRLMLVGLTSGNSAMFDLSMALRKRLRIIGTVLRGRSVDEKAEATRLFAEQVVPLLANGTVVPNVDKIFPVEKVREAHEYLESNESFGKIILEF